MTVEESFRFLTSFLDNEIHRVLIVDNTISIDSSGPFKVDPGMISAMEEAGFEVPVGYYSTRHYGELMRRAYQMWQDIL